MSTPSHTETDPARVHRAPIVIEEPLDESSLPALDPEAYELLDEIARGGMGRILRARDRLGRIVAVKQLLEPSPHHVALFEREARITARLQHPSIVSVIEAGVLPDGQRVYVMKLVPGRSLKQVLREGRDVLERLRDLPIVIAIADALAYAHAQGVIHRDLKPSNVLIGEFGEVVVIDWGLAHDREHRGPSSPEADPLDGQSSITAKAMGTPAYMSPEAARGESVDGRADVYAIGAILYELLSGAPPYAGTGAEILAAVRTGGPLPIAERVRGTPPDLSAIVGKAMARDRDARYPSAKELADELRRFATGQLVSAHAYSLRERMVRWVRRHKAPVAVAAAALVVIGTLTAISFNRIVEQRNLATARAEDLTLAHARLELDRDPTVALATLVDLPADSSSWSAARIIAADAIARGIPQHVRLARPSDAVALVGSRPRVVVRQDDAVEVIEVDSRSDVGEPARVVARFATVAAAVALSADGSTVATLGDGSLRAWRVAAPDRPVLERAGPRIQTALALSADGAVLVASGSDTGLVVVRVADGGELVRDDQLRELSQVVVARDAVLGVDARGALVARSFGSDADTNNAVLAGALRTIRAVASSGELVVAATGQGELQLLAPHREPRALATGMTASALAVSPDGNAIAIAGDSGVAVFDRSGARVRSLAGRRRPRAIAIDDAGTVVVIEREHVSWWSARADRTPIAPTRAASALALGTVGRAVGGPRGAASARTIAVPLVIGGDDGSVWLAAAGSGTAELAVRLGGHMAAVRAVAIAADSSFAVTTGDDRAVRRWSLAGARPAVLGSERLAVAPPSTLLGMHHGPGLAIAVSPTGAVASGGVDRLVQLWRSSGPTPELANVVLGRHRGAIRALAFSPDGYELVSIADDREAIVWSLAGHPERRLAHDAPVTAVAWLADGSLITGARDGRVTWWARGSTTGRVLATHAGAVRAIATAGELIATGGDDTRVGIGDSGGMSLHAGHADLVRGLAVAADGSSVASASEDGTVRIWDPATGESRAIAQGGWVAGVAITPAGSVIAVGATGAWSIADELPRDHEALHRAIAERVDATR